MPSFSFIGYTLTELFRKPDNSRQIHKQTSSTFYTSNQLCVDKKKNYVITRLRNSNRCLITFFKKKYRSSQRKYRRSHRRSSVKKSVLKNFANFTGKHLRWRIFLIMLQAFTLQAFYKETPTQVLSCEVWETFKNTYFEEHLKTTSSGGVL